jgi:ribosome maturation factor RimP
MGAEQQIADLIRPIVQAAGLEIWDVERSGASVRVLVERPGGVDLDAISDLSRAVSSVLDQRDDLVPDGRYTLEVSSPGLERRLRYPRHFASYIGQEVAVKTASPINGVRRIKGTLARATDEDITVAALLPSGELGELSVPLELIDRANAVFNWGPALTAPKPARAAARAKGSAVTANRAAPTNRAAHRADVGDRPTADVVLAEVPEEAV